MSMKHQACNPPAGEEQEEEQVDEDAVLAIPVGVLVALRILLVCGLSWAQAALLCVCHLRIFLAGFRQLVVVIGNVVVGVATRDHARLEGGVLRVGGIGLLELLSVRVVM